MKKTLSITLAMLLIMGLVLPTGASAYTYTEVTEEDMSQYFSEPLTSVKMYRDDSYEHFNSDGTYRPDDYLEASVSGDTLNLKVVQTSCDNDTCSFEAITYDNQDKVDAYAVPIQNSVYNASLDLSKFDGTQSLSISADIAQTGNDVEYFMWSDMKNCRLYKINGSWCFRYYGNIAVQREANQECMDELNSYKNPYNTSWKYSDINQDYKNKANELCAGLTNDFSKAYAIYKWLTDTFNYGHAKTVDGISSSSWKCEDFAYAMRRLCNAVGIPCVVPGGTLETCYTLAKAKSAWVNHGWNAVYVDNRWIMCDAANKMPFDMTYDYFCSEFNYITSGVNTGASDAPCSDGQLDNQGNEPASTKAALHSTLTILMNGKHVKVSTYNIDGYNYIKLRDVAHLINKTGKEFSVGWDAANNAIKLVSGEDYVDVGGELAVNANGSDSSATPTSSTVYLNGKQVGLTAYNIMGNNYFKLRDIGSAVNFGVDWNSDTGEISIITTKGYAA